MLYMIQINVEADSWDSVMAGYSEDDTKAMFAHMGALNDELTAAGELVEVRGLGGPGLAKTVRASEKGAPQVTDGPSLKGGILAGYWVVDVASEERSIEIAARASACPGPGGTPCNDPVEIHRIPAAPTA
ncbi:YciI family protein [Streptomyces sp. NPDC001904]|uniref:YciI family protein n=1 Tax=Streptomyces sp. NPDC001904 TaxID=3154531 RepID=UPI003320E577